MRCVDHARSEAAVANKEGVANRPEQQNLTIYDFPDSDRVIASLFSGSVPGIAIYDDQLRFRAVNQALADMHGFPVEAHAGKESFF